MFNDRDNKAPDEAYDIECPAEDDRRIEEPFCRIFGELDADDQWKQHNAQCLAGNKDVVDVFVVELLAHGAEADEIIGRQLDDVHQQNHGGKKEKLLQRLNALQDKPEIIISDKEQEGHYHDKSQGQQYGSAFR